jgi:hypothetical protein
MSIRKNKYCILADFYRHRGLVGIGNLLKELIIDIAKKGHLTDG